MMETQTTFDIVAGLLQGKKLSLQFAETLRFEHQ